jgi:hypothetical protein
MTTQKTLINFEALLIALAQQTQPLTESLQHSLQEVGQALQNNQPNAAYQLRELIKQEPLLEIAYQNALEQWDEQYASQERAKSLSAAFQNPSILGSLFLKDVAPSQDWVTAARKITHQQTVQPTSARFWIKGASISGAIAQIASAFASATVTAVHKWSTGFSKQATVMTPDLSNILSLEETAAYLRLSPATVVQRALQGDIPGQHIDNTWHFLKPEIDHWQQTHDKRTILLKQAGSLRPLSEGAITEALLTTEAGIQRTEQRLQTFEQKYQLSTQDFLNRYENDEFPETLDLDEWIGEFRMLQRLQEKAARLQGIEFAN